MEDRTIIVPAVEALRADGIDVVGPLSADAMFHPAARAGYDAAICMYHDQALIPAKTLAFSETVNVTLGLAFVRTSPDHGTAFDIAGTGRADPSSLAAALRLAAELVAQRKRWMSAIDDLPPLRDVIARHRLSALKGLGQNFLLDLNLTARIARAAGSLEGVTVIEVGPGPGGLTRALLAAGARKVVAIERDERCLPALDEIAARYPGRLAVVHDDALAVDFARSGRGADADRRQPPLQRRHAAPGRLAADRALAAVLRIDDADVPARGGGTHRRDAGLEVLRAPRRSRRLAKRCPHPVRHPRRRAFTPPPKVMSSVVGFIPKPSPLPVDAAVLERVVAAAFGQRRKMLRQSLKTLGVDPLPLLDAAGIEPTQRAEEIDVGGFVALANAFAARAT